MREETGEVRIKLHITAQNDPTVRNLWMCLNYNQKPTIEHIVDHIRKNYSDYFSEQKENGPQHKLGFETEDSAKLASQIKLYLDDYWLPPYENSRLIRENDCIKVSVKLDEQQKDQYPAEKSKIKNDNLFSYYNSNNDNKLQPKNTMYNFTKSNENEAANCDYYNYNFSMNGPQTCLDCCGKQCQPTCGWNFGLNEPKQQQQPAQKLNNLNKDNDLNSKKAKTADVMEKNQLKSQTNEAAKKSGKQNAGKSNERKRSNVQEDEESDGLSEEQVIDDYYKSLQHNKPLKNKSKQENNQQQPIASSSKNNTSTESKNTNKKQQQQQITSEPVDLDKIASKVNSSGKLKWKNSTKPTTTNGPKHIIFSSSESSSDSESESETKNAKTEQLTDSAITKKIQGAKRIEPPLPPKYYMPKKEEQLNAVSNNRSFVVENPKTLAEFKRVFNETKLNAPKAEEFCENKLKEVEEAKQEVVKSNKNEDLDDSFSSTMSTSSSNLSLNNDDSKSPKKKNRRRSRSPKIDYSSLESLVGAPRVDDKIAFQILEISSNFTPEVSGYKNGTVIEFDILTNEVTLKLHSKYNSVLKKPSKFSVVFEDDEEELKNEDAKSESSGSSNSDKAPKYEDEILKVDYRNLINVKLMPKDMRSKSPVQQLQQAKN